MNKIVFRYAMEYHGKVVKAYELMRSLKAMPPVIPEPSWVMFEDKAVPHARYYV
jgi:hypothetical protein